jgi:GT2 family glycosyltransferase
MVETVDVVRPGQVAALNAVVSAVTTPVVAFVDDDAVPHPEWIANIQLRFSLDAALGALGGPDIVHRQGIPVLGSTRSVGRLTRSGKLIGHHHLSPDKDQRVMFLKGANMAYRTCALDGFDERLWGSGAQVCNDLEASLSVHQRGWRVVFSPDVVVDHHPAVRLDEDQRDARSLAAECAEQHNELYVLLLHARGLTRLLAVARRVLVGSTRAPGIFLGVVIAFDTGHRRRRLSHLGRVSRLAGARLRALRTYRTGLRSRRTGYAPRRGSTTGPGRGH